MSKKKKVKTVDLLGDSPKAKRTRKKKDDKLSKKKSPKSSEELEEIYDENKRFRKSKGLKEAMADKPLKEDKIDSSGVCEDENGMRYTKYKKEELAVAQLNIYRSIGVMGSEYSAYKCKECNMYHVGKNEKDDRTKATKSIPHISKKR